MLRTSFPNSESEPQRARGSAAEIEFRLVFRTMCGTTIAGVFVCDEEGEVLRPLTEDDQERLDWCEESDEMWTPDIERVDLAEERARAARYALLIG